jgi:hypothetical protein
MVAVAGLRGLGDFGQDERPKSFREMILWRTPYAQGTPITALTSKIKSQAVDDFEFNWWDEPVTIVRLQQNGALAATDTLFTVDSVDPTTTVPNLNWGVAKHLKPGDLLLVEPVADAATFDQEVLMVEQVISDTQFVARRGASGTTPAVIANDQYYLLIGSAYAEGTSSPKGTSRNPMKYENYLQETKTAYSVTKESAAVKTRTGDVLKNEKMRKSFDHSRALELTTLFGRKSLSTDGEGRKLYTSNGLRAQIPAVRTTVFGAPVTVTTLMNAVSPVFDWASEAGDTRIAFCGNTALNSLNVMVQNSTNAKMELGNVIKVYGMNFREFILPQGRLLLKTHPLMNLHGLYQKSMFILDFSSFTRRYLKGFDTTPRDNLEAKDEMVHRGEWLTIDGLEVHNGGLTCAYLGNIT